MAKDVIMPVLGMNQDTAVLLAWLKRDGEHVEQGEPIMEVETDKATMELDAPASGTLAGIRAAAGDEVKAGSVIAVVLAEGEEAPQGTPTTPVQTAAAGPTPEPTTSAQAGLAAAGAARAGGGANAANLTVGGVRAARSATVAGIVPASPKARRLAAEQGVALEPLRGRGRGPDGAVLAADVTDAAARPAARPAAAVAPLRFERTLAAGSLLALLDWAQSWLRDQADGAGLALGDLIARFLAAAWSRQPLSGSGASARLHYRRVHDGEVSSLTVPLTDAVSLAALARARVAGSERGDAQVPAAAKTASQAAAEVGLLDLSDSRVDLVSDSLPAGAGIVEVVVGRSDERVLAEGGAAVVTRALRLAFAFDPARVRVAEAAAFSDRVIALAEEPRALALLY